MDAASQAVATLDKSLSDQENFLDSTLHQVNTWVASQQSLTASHTKLYRTKISSYEQDIKSKKGACLRYERLAERNELDKQQREQEVQMAVSEMAHHLKVRNEIPKEKEMREKEIRVLKGKLNRRIASMSFILSLCLFEKILCYWWFCERLSSSH